MERPINGLSAFLIIVCTLLLVSVAAATFPGCGTTYTCGKAVHDMRIVRHPSGAVEATLPCDGDRDAVVVRWAEFTKLRIKGFKCVDAEAPEPAEPTE